MQAVETSLKVEKKVHGNQLATDGQLPQRWTWSTAVNENTNGTTTTD